MRKLKLAVLVAAITLAPALTVAEDARSILKTALEKQAERWEGVDAYVIEQSAAGFSTTTTMRRTTVETGDGKSYPLFIPSASGAGPAGGLPEGAAPEPWAGIDPRAFDEAEHDAAARSHAQRMTDSMNAFIRTAKLVGSDSVDGRDAYHLQADRMNIVEPMNDEELRVDTMSMWMDKSHYVPLKMRMQGTISSADGSRPVTIETLMADYREVPGSNMYESYRQVVSMGGMLSEDQRAQIAEARQQLAKFEEQLAAMPDSQRRMMENMMGSQLEQFRKLAAGDGIEIETVVTGIRVNP